MSTTKDKPQGPYSAFNDGQHHYFKGKRVDLWDVIVTNGETVENVFTDAFAEKEAIDMSGALNESYFKGFSAGQADRDELVKALQRVEDELHKRYAHPDYEYEHSTTGRKQPDLKGEQLESEGWEEYKFQRDEWTDSRSYRRKKTITPNP